MITYNDEIEQTKRYIATNKKLILSNIYAKGFRELFGILGYSNVTPAGERLLALIDKRGFKKHNNLIDAYNIVSAKFAYGIGMHDISDGIETLEITRAEDNEFIVPIFKQEPIKVKKGDLLYKINGNSAACLGKKDVDSDEYKVLPDSSRLIIVALGNKLTSIEDNEFVINEVCNLIKKVLLIHK